MDILLSIINLPDEEFDDYVKQIKNSNLSRFTQNGLIDLLRTAAQQTVQAKEMGWL